MADDYVPFSRRAGRRPIRQLGLTDMPLALRRSLWNVIEPWLWKTMYGDEYRRRAEWIWNFHAVPSSWTTDRIPTEMLQHNTTEMVSRWLLVDASADDVYDFVEALPMMIVHGMNASSIEEIAKRDASQLERVLDIAGRYIRDANAMLEREGSPYRLLKDRLVPLTNVEEIAEVKTAVSGNDKFAPARDHIADGMMHLGARPPAYADCIKQAISAIESVLKIAVGADSWRMAQLLSGFEQKYGDLHPSLRAAIDKLYGYASDEDGVRHGAAEPVSVGEPEARAMLVTCSALMNFLIRKAST